MSNYKGTDTGITLAELIPSKDVRACIEETGRVLTDFEKATLIYNHSGMSFTEKAARLKVLMEQTEDGNLREEIQDRLSYDDLCISRFYENDGGYIYRLEVYDPEDDTSYEQGYCVSGSVAVTYGKRFKENFSVHKIVLLTEDVELDDCRVDSVAAVYFDNQGQVRGYYNSEVAWMAEKSEADWERFENAYITIPHPFRNGSFVRAKNNGRLGNEVCIVECNNDELIKPKHEYCDYDGTSLRVAYIYGAARFGHEHVSVVDLEFATPDEADPKYSLLYCAQSLTLGQGGLNDFQFICDEYKTRWREKGNEGVSD